MNEARFFWFFLYLIEIRNLDKENKVNMTVINMKHSIIFFSVEMVSRSQKSEKE